jgi:ketosteroid isomerase-like protein
MTDPNAAAISANRALTQRYLAALGAMDGPALAELHHEDVVFEMLGTTPVSGRFVGRDACLGEVFPPVIAALEPGSFSFAREAVIAVVDGSGAVAITRSDGDAVRGGRYEQVYFLALTIDDGRIVKLDAAYDTAHVQEVVFGDKLAQARPRPEFQLPPELGETAPGEAVPGGAARAVIEDYYAALAAGDMLRFVELHSPDVVFDLPGSTPVSGHFEGRDACLAGVIQPFLGTFDPERTTFGHRYRILCADDRRVAALMRGGGPTTSGGTADVIFVQVFTVENGLITHMHEQLDTAHIEDACFANPLRDNRARTSGGLEV